MTLFVGYVMMGQVPWAVINVELPKRCVTLNAGKCLKALVWPCPQLDCCWHNEAVEVNEGGMGDNQRDNHAHRTLSPKKWNIPELEEDIARGEHSWQQGPQPDKMNSLYWVYPQHPRQLQCSTEDLEGMLSSALPPLWSFPWSLYLSLFGELPSKFSTEHSERVEPKSFLSWIWMDVEEWESHLERGFPRGM